MTRQNKVAKTAEKKINDKKLEETADRLKALYEFVKFINEKCVRNRHERKVFWRNVSEGHPLVEDTIINVLRRMGVKEESIKEIEAEKIKELKQREDAGKVKKMAKDSAIGCPPDCSADCSKCANKPVASENKKDENKA
jgi:hypothetical protein